MADELVDIFDENFNLIGTAMKSQAHNEGLWHKVFHCWILKGDKVWLQLRGKNKELYPDLLDISAAGHLKAGETAKDGIREIEEELGLKVDFEKLNKLFTYKLAEDKDGAKNREFCPTYLLLTDEKLENLKLQDTEVDGVYEASTLDLLELISGKTPQIEIEGYKRGSKDKHVWKVGYNNLVPHGQAYYLKVIGALERYIHNAKLES